MRTRYYVRFVLAGDDDDGYAVFGPFAAVRICYGSVEAHMGDGDWFALADLRPGWVTWKIRAPYWKQATKAWKHRPRTLSWSDVYVFIASGTVKGAISVRPKE